MRKLTLVLAVFLVVVTVVPAGARSVTNESGSGLWLKAYVGDGTTHAMWNEDGEGWFDAHYGLEFDCGEPTDVAWARIDGEGQLDTHWIEPLKGGDRYMDGAASGMFDWGHLSYGFCDGSIPSVEVDLGDETPYMVELSGTSDRLVKGSDRDSRHVPGESNEHHTFKTTFREAFGHIDLGVPDCHEPCTTFGNGEIGKWSYSNHSNSK